MKLSEKVCVITGGSSKLGLELVRTFLHEGCKVAVCSRSAEHLKRLEELESLNNSSLLRIQCDIRYPLEVSNFIKKACFSFGSIDILINNASLYGVEQDICNYDPILFKALIETNLIGTFNMIQAVMPLMSEQNYGKIITVTQGFKPEQQNNSPAYSISQKALETLSNILAAEHKNSPISANIVDPSGINFSASPDLMVEQQEKNKELLKRLLGLFLYLSSAESNGISGKTFIGREWKNN